MYILCIFSAVGSEPCAGSSKEWGLRFLRSPVEFVCDEQRRKVAGVKMEINKLEVMDTSNQRCLC